MKITIAPVSGTSWGAEVELVPGGQGSPENVTVNGTSVVDMVQSLQQTTVIPLDRGNRTTTISFRYTDQKGTFLLSETDLIKYHSSLPRYGKITFYGEQALTTPFAYMVATITAFQHTQIGVTTIREFTLTGSVIVTSVPPVPLPFPPP